MKKEMKSFLTKKNEIIKTYESYKSRDRYQAGIALISN